MSGSEHSIHIAVKVTDENDLYTAALDHMVHKDGLKHAEAVDLLMPEGELDVRACLIALFDPGVSPPGTQINDSSVETHHL